MWTGLFSFAVFAGIVSSIGALVLRGRDPASFARAQLPLNNGAAPEDPFNALLVAPEIQLVMHADHVDEQELQADLHAMSVQLRKNAGPSVTFGRAVNRLRNMSEMMDRLGFDTETLARSNLDVQSAYCDCEGCQADEVCRNWLVRAPNLFAEAPTFCPNAERFADAKRVAITCGQHDQSRQPAFIG